MDDDAKLEFETALLASTEKNSSNLVVEEIVHIGPIVTMRCWLLLGLVGPRDIKEFYHGSLA